MCKVCIADTSSGSNIIFRLYQIFFVNNDNTNLYARDDDLETLWCREKRNI